MADDELPNLLQGNTYDRHVEVTSDLPFDGTTLDKRVNRPIRDGLKGADVHELRNLAERIDELQEEFVDLQKAKEAEAEAARLAAEAEADDAIKAAVAAQIEAAVEPVLEARPTQAVAPEVVVSNGQNDGMERHIIRREHAQNPPARYLSENRTRKLGKRDAFEVYDMARERQIKRGKRSNILLSGPTGSGKTWSALAYAAARGLEVAHISCKDSTDPFAVQGVTHMTSSASYFYEADLVPAVRGTIGPDGNLHGNLVILDEMQFLDPAVAGFFHPLLQEGVLIMDEGYTVEAHPETLIIGTMNPISSTYAGGKRQSEAFYDRFALHYDVDYDTELEKELVPFDRIHDLSEAVRLSDDFRTPFSTRLLNNWYEVGEDFGAADASDQLIARFSPSEQPALRNLYDTLVGDASEVFGEEAAVEVADEFANLDI